MLILIALITAVRIISGIESDETSPTNSGEQSQTNAPRGILFDIKTMNVNPSTTMMWSKKTIIAIGIFCNVFSKSRYFLITRSGYTSIFLTYNIYIRDIVDIRFIDKYRISYRQRKLTIINDKRYDYI